MSIAYMAECTGCKSVFLCASCQLPLSGAKGGTCNGNYVSCHSCLEMYPIVSAGSDDPYDWVIVATRIRGWVSGEKIIACKKCYGHFVLVSNGLEVEDTVLSVRSEEMVPKSHICMPNRASCIRCNNNKAKDWCIRWPTFDDYHDVLGILLSPDNKVEKKQIFTILAAMDAIFTKIKDWVAVAKIWKECKGSFDKEIFDIAEKYEHPMNNRIRGFYRDVAAYYNSDINKKILRGKGKS